MATGMLTVNALKIKLAERGASTRGRKEELIERLEAYERNLNFQDEPLLIPGPSITSWPEWGFKELSVSHHDMIPKLHKSVVEGYFVYRQVCDQAGAKDLKALAKGTRLLEARNIDAMSFFRDESAIFYTGIVRAAMKKKVSYNIKLKVDLFGEVLATECECPCGMGPHSTCKHVAAVLLMLAEFSSTGKLPLRGSCTAELQTFHKPRKTYHGSPAKSEKLGTLRQQSLVMEDPRPAQFRNLPGYEDNVRNLVVNYCAATSQDLTMRYLYPTADLQTAVADHDYSKLPWTEYWVDQSNDVTQKACQLIEQNTREQSRSPMWHQERSWRITASKFGDILTSTPRRNMEKLCNYLSNSKELNTPAILHGKQYEPVAMAKFQEVLGLMVAKCGLFISQDAPFLGATPDGVVGTDGILEIKCPYNGRHCNITPGKEFPYLVSTGSSIKLKKTSKYYYQVQGQLLVTRRNKCYFVVYTFVDFHVEVIPADTEFAQYSMLPRLKLFYEKYYRKHIASRL